MEPELEKRLAALESLTKENHTMLAKMRRGQIWASIFRVVYWLIILGAGVASYYFLQPYLQQLFETYTKIQAQISHLNSFVK